LVTEGAWPARANAAPRVLVVCLCADWCDVCRDYRRGFEQVQEAIQADHPQAQFVWLDVEDDADLLHPLDVDDFPTLLIAIDNAPRFFGPLTPQPQTLERLLRSSVRDASAAVLADPDLHAAVARIQAHQPTAR